MPMKLRGILLLIAAFLLFSNAAFAFTVDIPFQTEQDILTTCDKAIICGNNGSLC